MTAQNQTASGLSALSEHFRDFAMGLALSLAVTTLLLPTVMAFICGSCGHRDYRSSFSFSQQGVFTDSGRSDSPSPEQLRENLDQVRTTIIRQKAYLDELEETRGRLESELAQIVYPVLSLPPEIVSCIFVECTGVLDS
jgi:hypothetical protein